MFLNILLHIFANTVRKNIILLCRPNLSQQYWFWVTDQGVLIFLCEGNVVFNLG